MKRASLLCLLALLAGALCNTVAQQRVATTQRFPVIFDARTTDAAALQNRAMSGLHEVNTAFAAAL